jgi:hypothetical protein
VHIFSLAEKAHSSMTDEGRGDAVVPSKGTTGTQPKSPSASNAQGNVNNPNSNTFAGYSEREREREREGESAMQSPSTVNKSLGLNFLRGIVPKGLMPKYLDR